MLLTALLLPTVTACADDWPNWRGPQHNDKSTETNLLQEWPYGGPKQLWQIDNAGVGYAGFSVVGDRLYTLGQEDEKQFALCLDATDGTEVWRKNFDEAYVNRRGDGPRSTPSIDGDHGYFFGSSGQLVCLNLADGQQVWSVNMSQFGGDIPFWGYSESPLVDDNKVLCTPGGPDGTILALDKLTGKKIWQSPAVTRPAEEDEPSEPAKAHYASIVPVDFNGQRQYVQLTVLAIVGVSADDGKLLWQSDWPGRTAVIPSPLVDGDLVYVTSGYGIGCKLIRINDAETPEELWRNKVMKNHHGGVVQVGKHYFGHSDPGGLTCQDQASGERVWSFKSIRKGAISWADGRFYYVQESDGRVILLELDETKPDKSAVKGNFILKPQSDQRGMGEVWTHPVIANGRLFLRDQEFIFCYDISK